MMSFNSKSSFILIFFLKCQNNYIYITGWTQLYNLVRVVKTVPPDMVAKGKKSRMYHLESTYLKKLNYGGFMYNEF